MPFVVAHEDTGAFVKALVDLPPGKNLLGVSEHMTWPEWTKLWGEVLGVKATFKQVSEDDYFRGAPDPLKKELAETFAYVEEFGYTGGDPEVLTVEQVSLICLHKHPCCVTPVLTICSLVSRFRLHRWNST